MEKIVVMLTFALLISSTLSQQLHLTDYNEADARALLGLAAGAYSNTPETCVKNTMPAEQQWYLINAENTLCDADENTCAGYTVRSDVLRQYIVVFRGTKTKKQLFIEGIKSIKPGVDFFGAGNVSFIPFKYNPVNRYFFRALSSIWPSIEPLLKDPDFRSYTVTFTGHSLGGALASLASMQAVLAGLRTPDEVRLVTFGQPRVGDRDFAMKHDELVPHSFRVVHRADIVPHLPACRKDEDDPQTKDLPSKPCDTDGDTKAYHHGIEIWYPNGMQQGAQYMECLGPPKDEDFACSDRLTFEVSKYDEYVRDHRHYFDVKVTTFGKLGCVVQTNGGETMERQTVQSLNSAPSQQSKSGSTIQKILNGVNKVAHLFGFDKK